MGEDTKEAIIRLFNDELSKIRSVVTKVLFTFGCAIVLIGVGYGKILSDISNIKGDINDIKDAEYVSMDTYLMLRQADLEWRKNQENMNESILNKIDDFNEKIYNDNKSNLRGIKTVKK